MNSFMRRRLLVLLSMASVVSFATQAEASGFQLWEQSGASIGNYHAGYAAEANDASIAFFNPAGITLIPNQQIVVSGVAIMPDFKYKGDVTVITYDDFYPNKMASQTFNGVVGQGGIFSFVPSLHYVAPISDRVGFGFSVTAPFGLKTDYGRSTPLQYAATLSSIEVIDVSPDLAFQWTKQFSIGAGFDVQFMNGDFNNIAALVIPALPTTGELFSAENSPVTNSLSDTAYGEHLGVLYQFSPTWRAGLSYHGQVVHKLTGTSKLVGPLVGLATASNQNVLESNQASTKITLPPYTALSVYGMLNPKVALMGSIIYTQWSTFNQFVLKNAAGIVNSLPTTNLEVDIPENYQNSWNLSVGADYFVADNITLKGGLGYDESPVNNAYRNIQLPDNSRFIIAMGVHYQAIKSVGIDFDWSHLFIQSGSVNPPPQVTGDQTVVTNGTVTGGADVFGAQLTWDIV